METNSLGFIGGGRITKIFLQAFANKQQLFSRVVVFDTNAEVLQSLKELFPDIEIAESLQHVAQQSTVFIALHPPMIMETLEKIGNDVDEYALVVSLAPKITAPTLSSSRFKAMPLTRESNSTNSPTCTLSRP